MVDSGHHFLLVLGKFSLIGRDHFLYISDIALDDAVLLVESGGVFFIIFEFELFFEILNPLDQPLICPGEGGDDLLEFDDLVI